MKAMQLCLEELKAREKARMENLAESKLHAADHAIAHGCQLAVVHKSRLGHFYDARRIDPGLSGHRLVTEQEVFKDWVAYMHDASPVEICKMEALGYTEDVRMILKETPPSELEVLGAYSFACLPGQVEDAMEFMELKGNTAWEFLYTKAQQAILHELELKNSI